MNHPLFQFNNFGNEPSGDTFVKKYGMTFSVLVALALLFYSLPNKIEKDDDDIDPNHPEFQKIKNHINKLPKENKEAFEFYLRRYDFKKEPIPAVANSKKWKLGKSIARSFNKKYGYQEMIYFKNSNYKIKK